MWEATGVLKDSDIKELFVASFELGGKFYSLCWLGILGVEFHIS